MTGGYLPSSDEVEETSELVVVMAQEMTAEPVAHNNSDSGAFGFGTWLQRRSRVMAL